MIPNKVERFLWPTVYIQRIFFHTAFYNTRNYTKTHNYLYNRVSAHITLYAVKRWY